MRSLLLRLAARRPHVLLIAAPGASTTRLAVEAAVADRRWALAGSPADADVLVVAGVAGPRLTTLADAVWDTVPAPRTRCVVTSPFEVDAALDDAAATLARGGVRWRADLPDDAAAMADLADGDRDGLALDALHVPLGPVLPGWPPGLVVHAVLAGDLVTDAVAEVLDVPADAEESFDGLDPDTARLDALVRLLTVAGHDAGAARARRLRDDADRSPRVVAALGRRLGGDRLLRWSLGGSDTAGAPAGVDVPGRLRHWCRELGTGVPYDGRATPQEAAAALVGHELGRARLVLAALDPDPTRGAGPVEPFVPAGGGHEHHHDHDHDHDHGEHDHGGAER